MKTELLILSKPYPKFKLVKDGQDIVISIGKFYLRIMKG